MLKKREDKDIFENKDIEAMLAHMRTLNSHLKEKTERFYELSGYSSREAEIFFSNPTNFSEDQWNEMQKQKQKAEILFKDVAPTKEIKKKILEKQGTKARRKTLGVRKGWISM